MDDLEEHELEQRPMALSQPILPFGRCRQRFQLDVVQSAQGDEVSPELGPPSTLNLLTGP